MSKSFTGLLFLFLISPYLLAQETVKTTPDSVLRFSLVQAQDYALKNSFSHKNKIIDVEIAKMKVWETTAIGLPQISGNVKYQHFLDIPTSLLPAEIFGGPAGVYTPVKFGTSDNFNFGVTVTELIFSGEYIVGLQAAKTFKDLSIRSLEKSEKDTRESVAQAYYLALVLQHNVSILDSSLRNTESIKKDMQAMFKAGFIEETDFDQISLTVGNLRSTQGTLLRQAEMSLNLLKLQLGMELEQIIVLTDDLETIISNSNIESTSLQTFNINSNSDYRLMETNEALTMLSLKRAKSKFLPTLAGFLSYSNGAQRNEFDFFKDGTPWFPTSLVGLQLDIPIFSSGMRYAQVKQAKMALDQVKNTKEQVRVGLTIDFAKTKSDFISANEKYYSEKENIALATKIYNKIVAKYKQGLSSSMDLIQAQNQMLNAQSNYFKAQVEMLNAKAKLDKQISK
ncbi:MAG TPA: hypothetical protein DCQ31_18060 [Bacteroidales bacterium]|nr:hypothetical protein [Bacteroidales bacterium]